MAPDSEQLSPEEVQFEELLPGTMLDDRYRIVERLDEGGIGLVYRALHTKLRREVAVKVLRHKFVTHESLRPRFEREAQALAALTHPNVVAVSDYGVIEGRPYLVMELLSGRTLREELSGGIPNVEATMDIAQQFLRGLAYAHTRGVVHRDVKPGNIFLHDLGAQGFQVKLLDFGFAQLLHRWDRPDAPVVSNAEEAFGTPSYMAPEQLSSGKTGPRTDVYGTGIVLYEMLTGKKPFRGPIDEVVRQHLSVPAPLLTDGRAELEPSAALAEIVRKALSKSPNLRYADASEMLAAMDSLPSPPATLQVLEETGETLLTDGDSGDASRRGTTWLVLGLLTVALGVGWYFSEVGWPQLAEVSAPAAAPVPEPEPAPLPAELAVAPELEPEPEEPEPGAGLGLEPGAGPGAGLGLEPGAGPGSEPEPGAGPGSEPEPGAGPGSEPEPGPGSEPEPEPEPGPGPGSEPEPEPEPAPEPEPEARAHSFVTDPSLRSLGRALDRGRPLSTEEIRELRDRASADRTNPGPHLILARAYDARGWRTDAIDRYLLALEIDPRTRSYPPMLRDLIRLAGHPNVGRRAALVIERTFGRTALPAVEQAQAQPGLTPMQTRKLQRLHERLSEL